MFIRIKFVFFFFLVLFSVFSFSFAQESGFITKIVPVNLGFDNPIQKVFAHFCHRGFNKLENYSVISLYPNYQNDVCVVFTNHLTGDISIAMNIVETTKNNVGDDACKSSLDITSFSKSILSDPHPQFFTIPAGKSLVRFIPFLVSDHFTGNTRGCLVYTINNNLFHTGTEIFKIVVYKTNAFDLLIEKRTFLKDIKMFLLYYYRWILWSIVIFSFIFFIYLSLKERKK